VNGLQLSYVEGADNGSPDDGTLVGVMSQEDADRVMSMLDDGRYLSLDDAGGCC